MPLKHKSTAYKPLPFNNPFTEGQDRAYADILQGAIRDKNFWRYFVGIGVLLLFGISLLFFVYATRQQKTIPVLINVMPTGETQYLGEVRQSGAMQVPESAINWQIRKFITNLRTISTDYQVVFNNIDECYVMVTRSYSQVMSNNLRANSPFDLVGKIRRTVEFETLLNVTGQSYQVDWHETTVDSQNTRKVKMRAIVTIRLLPVTDQNIKVNPLGIYIDNFEMTQL